MYSSLREDQEFIYLFFEFKIVIGYLSEVVQEVVVCMC